MCGIVGYIGNRDARGILLESLKRLEYRGYDSAGLCVLENGWIRLAKAKGPIRELETKIQSIPTGATLGIAHTRWATHGEPSEINAHPHLDCNKMIAVVHNGIIENYMSLKRRLVGEGHVFTSDTDTEVLAHLIAKYYKQNLSDAVRQALGQVRGAYGLAVIAADQPNVIVGARHGSPLVVGIGENEEYFLASDVAALLPYTKKVIYPADGEMVRVSRQGVSTVMIKTNQFIEHAPETVDWDVEATEKNGFPNYMLKEIFEQPQVIRNALAGRLLADDGITKLTGLNLTDDELRSVSRVLFLACGTSAFVGLAGKYMVEEYAGIPAEIALASEFRYSRFTVDPGTLVLAISQSGETADTIAAMREVKRKGMRVLGITNVVGSTIARETDGGLFVHAGPEIGVAATKTYTGELAILALLALQMGRLRGLSAGDGRRIAGALARLPHQIETLLGASDAIKRIAEKYVATEHIFFLGRKFNYATAHEGALKLKELSYIHAEAYAAGETKHGPIALIDDRFPTIVVVPQDSIYEKTRSNLEEIRTRHGKIIAIATTGDTEISRIADDVMYIPQTEEMLLPIIGAIPVQLFAYHIATALGRDVDRPRNLAKSVTVE